MQGNDEEAPSLVDLCLERLRMSSVTDVSWMPTELLERLIAEFSSEELLKIDLNNEVSSVTDPVWERFYEREFGPEDAERVHQNLGMYDEPFKWSDLFHEKLCSEGVYNRYPFAPMAPPVRRRTKLVTDIYSPHEKVQEGPCSSNLTPAASTSQKDIKNEKEVAVYDAITTDGVKRPLYISNARGKKQIELYIVCPPSQDHRFVDQIVGTTSVTITHVSTLPEGRVYRVSSTEDFVPKSPAAEAVMQLYEGFRTSTQLGHEIRLIVKEQSRDLKLWATVHGAEMFVKDNGDTIVKISGRKLEVNKSFKRLLLLLRRGFFTASDADADTETGAGAEDT